MDKYRKVFKPKEETAKSDEDIRVTAAGSVSAYVSRAATVFNELKKPYVIVQATGNALTKAVTAAEVIKRRFKGSHQITELKTVEIVDEYEPMEEGLDKVTDTRNVSVIEIRSSKEELDSSNKGYQPPSDESLVKEFDPEESARGRGRGGGTGKGRGKGKGRGRGSTKGKGRGKGKGKSSEGAKGKGSGKSAGKSGKGGKGKGKSSKGKYEDDSAPKGKGKGKSKGKSKSKYDEEPKGKGKSSKGSKGSKGKGKSKSSGYEASYSYAPPSRGASGKGRSSDWSYEDKSYGKSQSWGRSYDDYGSKGKSGGKSGKGKGKSSKGGSYSYSSYNNYY